jgi:hypothetical protein
MRAQSRYLVAMGRVRLVALAVVAASFAAVPVAQGAAPPEPVDAGGLETFDQTNIAFGALTPEVFQGRNAVHATYDGSGDNGFARGIYEVDWQDGEEVVYGAYFYLPSASYRDNLLGQSDMLRWDNWPTFESSGDNNGGVLFGSDQRSRFARFGYSRPVEEMFKLGLPLDRWFLLTVHQILRSDSGGLTEVYVDNQLAGRDVGPSSYGRHVERLRIGMVAVAAGSQTKPLELWFSGPFAREGAFTPPPGTPPVGGSGQDLRLSGGTFTASTIKVSGSGKGKVRLTVTCKGGRASKTVMARKGRFSTSIRTPSACRKAKSVKVTAKAGGETVKRTLRRR